MSSMSRAGPRGGKGVAKVDSGGGSGTASKPHKTDPKADSPKASDLNPKSQPTAEQMRLAQIIDTKTEDPDLKYKIKQVMDATRKSEDEVCTALHDCDNDLDRAVNMLLEGEGQGEWETSGKKKKNRNTGPTVTSRDKADNNRDRSEPGESGGPDRERSRPRGSRGAAPPRMRGRGTSDSRAWKGRENKENEKNFHDEGGIQDGIPRRGGRMMNGPGRSGRGGRGGRPGPRTFQSREKGGPGFPHSIDTWNPQGEGEPTEPSSNGPDYGAENWDDDFPSPEDWDNEEYTGSLADTKVFTPSSSLGMQMGPSSSVVKSSMSANPSMVLDSLQDPMTQELAAASLSMASVAQGVANTNSLETAASMLPQSLTSNLPKSQASAASKSLTPAQSQYFSQLSQGSENLKSVGVGNSSVPASNGGSDANSYVSAVNAGSYSATVASSPAYQTSSTAAYTASPASYSATTYGSAPSYSSQIKGSAASLTQQQQQAMQARPKAQRPRVPPPSKIPASAVEMPGDAVNSSISFLDVQFGGLEFGSETSSFDFSANTSAPETGSTKYQSSSSTGLDSMASAQAPASVGAQIDLNSMGVGKGQQPGAMDGYPSNATNTNSSTTGGQSSAPAQHTKDLSQASSLSSAISQNQKLGGADSMTFPSQAAEHKPQPSAASYSQSRGGATSNSGTTGLDMSKSDPSSGTALSYSNSGSGGGSTYQGSYQNSSNVYQPASYTSSSSNKGYPASQGASSAGSQYQTNPQNQSSAYSANQPSYNSQATAATFPSASQAPSTTYSQTGSSNSYQSQSSSSVYQSSGGYPSMSQPAASTGPSYPSSQQYQSGSQNYSAAGGNSSGYVPSASNSQYSYGSNGPVTSATSLHATSSTSNKLGASMGSSSKDSQYDTPSTAPSSSLGSGSAQGSNTATPGTMGLVTSAGQAASNTAASSTKVTNSSAGKTGAILPTLAPGVPPAMLGQHQYIMGQQGMPYFNVQQPIFGYEDYQHQLMQQSRVPMQTGGFYDLSSLTAGRESGMPSVAYSVSDGRFARTDNNSSPVPSTLSQQNPTQAHQQPMLNPATLPPGYAYFYGAAGVVPGGFQYGTPALYQLPTATNAHGASNSTQYAKPASYNSGYGSGYDSLSGQGSDYGKATGGYLSGSQTAQGSKGSVVGSAGSSGSAAAAASDLGSNIYGKTPVVLSKVNSYDKQGFHSGTPPPFSLPGSQTNQMGAPSYAPLFIPTMAPHQQLHQPLHQMEFRTQGRRSDSGSSSGQRTQPTSQQSKSGVKQGYNTSYWAQN